MKLWIAFVLIVGVGLIWTPSAMAASAPPPSSPVWNLTVPQAIGLGDTLNVEVEGPRAAPFSLNLTAQPFNHSFPVFLYYFSLPPSKNNSTVETFLNLTIPTTDLDLGAYQLALANASGTITDVVVHFTLPVNVTSLNENVTILSVIVAGFEYQLAGFNGVLTNQSFAFRVLFVFAVAASGLALTMEIVRTGWRRLRATAGNLSRRWYTLWHEPTIHSYAVGAVHEYQTVLSADPVKDGNSHTYIVHPERYCRGDYCRYDRAAYFTESEIQAHCREVHNIPNPTLNRDYYIDQEMYDYIQSLRERDPTRGGKLAKTETNVLRLDLSDL